MWVVFLFRFYVTNDNLICFFFNCFLSFQLFFDDSVRNLLTAKRLGLHTVAVSSPYLFEWTKY